MKILIKALQLGLLILIPITYLPLLFPALIMWSMMMIIRLICVSVQPTFNITSPIIGNSKTTPSFSSISLSSSLSSSSSSSGKSVTNILHSIIKFKHKSHEEIEKKARRKLYLPSVMTSAHWTALKRASEQEKEEAEKKKEQNG